MLGSVSEADDALQESWLRLNRADASGIENPGGWLTTVVARVCLNMLRSRKTRREESLSVHVPDPIVNRDDGVDPEQEALLADAVGLALLVVLETLTPAERLAFVLHDMFAVPFEEIAPIVQRSPEAARQLASRARRRVQDGAAVPDADLSRQREVVDAFFAAARGGDFDALLDVLDPDVVARSDGGATRPGLSIVVRGAAELAGRAMTFAATCVGRTAGPRERRCRCRHHAQRTTVLDHGVHGREREDRRNRRTRRPRATPAARSRVPRQRELNRSGRYRLDPAAVLIGRTISDVLRNVITFIVMFARSH